MDQEVKAFFLDLDHERLADVLDRYERKFGSDKRAYAEQTFPRWRSGDRQMSGLIAGRLFDLLPPIMPIDLKLRIVEGLFEKAGNSNTNYVLVPMDTDPADVVRFVDETCFEYLSDVGIDTSIKRQFDWLSGEDAAVAERLFKHSMQVTFDAKKAASAAMMAQLDRDRVMHADTIKGITSTIRLQQHEVHIKRTDAVEEMRTVDHWTFDRGGRPHTTPLSDSGWGWIMLVLSGIGALIVLANQ
ncbi:hypothetical protein OCH239_17435 [Roseivivax halodurans JCM 10272]|uniref:Uncharacterized protein n=2 Tax=Roseivivax halodurans TaxID=93683 RepID=X7E9F6_9RHOB|nr:hypothetical protein OCH239_17435 [Roseivivax halodurans JCM 10272]